MANTATVALYGDLIDFTAGADRRTVPDGAGRSVKDVIEAIGVPHPEVMRIVINDRDVGFEALVAAGDRIEVFPAAGPLDVTAAPPLGREPLPEVRFLADVHLGRLVRYLRLLGFDCYYQPPWDDELLAAICSRDRRIMLTRDRGLLKRRCIEFGCFLRSDDPFTQAQELLKRFDLQRQVAPFSRCMNCSGTLQRVRKEDIVDQLPPGTRRNYDEFYQCRDCAKIFWRGAHFGRLQEQLAALTSAATDNPEGDGE